MIKKRTLPLSTGILEVPPLAFGSVKIGRNEKVKYPKPYDLPDDDAVSSLLRYLQNGGITMIDTAPAYGLAEERIGRLLPGKRADWILSTKVGEFFEQGHSTWDFTPDTLQRSLEESLRRLRTDYVDLVHLHLNPEVEMDVLKNAGVERVLHGFVEQGLARGVGASTYTVTGGKRAVDMLDTAMITLNPLDTAAQAVASYATEKNKAVFVKKAMVSGHLNENITPENCLRFGLKTDGVASLIIGSITPKNWEENMALLSKQR